MSENKETITQWKEEHKKLYWDVIELLQDMQNKGSSLRWLLNMTQENKTTKNLEKAMYHINIAIDIIKGTILNQD